MKILFAILIVALAWVNMPQPMLVHRVNVVYCWQQDALTYCHIEEVN